MVSKSLVSRQCHRQCRLRCLRYRQTFQADHRLILRLRSLSRRILTHTPITKRHRHLRRSRDNSCLAEVRSAACRGNLDISGSPKIPDLHAIHVASFALPSANYKSDNAAVTDQMVVAENSSILFAHEPNEFSEPANSRTISVQTRAILRQLRRGLMLGSLSIQGRE